MTLGVVLLDMCEFRRIFESRNIPVEVSKPFMDIRVPWADISDICLCEALATNLLVSFPKGQAYLEVLHIGDIESNHGSEEPDIHLGDVLAVVERTFSFR